MFYNLVNISEIDLSNFDASKITTMESMFYGCTGLDNIIFGNINTSSVKNMSYLFYDCNKLTSIDVSKFDTSSVIDMEYMFSGCNELNSINISMFNISNLNSMRDIFGRCYKITSMDLTDLDLSTVSNMRAIFYRNYNIKYINMYNADGKSVNNIKYIFSNCKSVLCINLKSFVANNEIDSKNSLREINPNAKICIDDIYTYNLLFENLTLNCSDICFQDNIKYDIKNNEYVAECDINKFEYKNECHIDCPESTFRLIKGRRICVDEIPENYYLDYNDNIYKECYKLCKKCNESGNDINNNCDECINNYVFLNDNFVNNKNCFEKCNYFYYFDENNNYNCSQNYLCPENYKLIIEKNKCIDECKNYEENMYEYNKTCLNQCPNGTIPENFTNLCYHEERMEKTDNNINTTDINNETTDFINITSNKINKTEIIRDKMKNLINEYNFSDIENYFNIEIIEYNISIELTTTTNQKINENSKKKKVTINIGECENKLKDYYNISYNDSLYIMKVDKSIEGIKIPKVEYEIYYPLYNQGLTKLDSEICKGTKVDISIPATIEDDIDKYNPKSSYYNDICSKSNSKNGTDITLADRKNEYINNNMSLCEENCDLIDYNYETKKAKCSCNMKTNIPLFEDIKFDKNLLYKKFIDINNVFNIKIIKCYKSVFNKSLKKNYGFFIILLIMLLFIVSICIFYIKSFNILKNDINDIVSALKDKNTIYYKKKRKVKSKNKKKKIISDNSSNANFNNIYAVNNDVKITKKNIKISQDNNNDKILKKIKFEYNPKNQNQNLHNSQILEYEDFELNNLEYSLAINSDKRTYFQFYISLLKIKHLFIFSFWPCKDYNSKIIKIFLFFFFFSLHFTINALFFNDSTMHKIYEDNGNFNFIYQIPQIIYSSIISGIISCIIKNLSLSQKIIIKLKQEKDNDANILDKKRNSTLKLLKINFAIFFIFTFVFILFSWYYITCFCGIYVNTQAYLIKDSVISFVCGLIYPIFICLIPGIFRIWALRDKNGSLKFIYKFSLILIMII